MTLLRRVIAEKRAALIPLGLVLVANVLAYALIVYPLVRRSEGISDRAAAASATLKAAQADYTAAQALVTGQAKAKEALATFYDKVLPRNFVAASRLTYTLLPDLAKKTNVRYQGGSFEDDPNLRDTRFGRVHAKMLLQVDYENLRKFIYALETTPEFVIIDGVSLAQAEEGKPLILNLELSTYYRKTNGS